MTPVPSRFRRPKFSSPVCVGRSTPASTSPPAERSFKRSCAESSSTLRVRASRDRRRSSLSTPSPARVHLLPVVIELERDGVVLLAQELHRALEHVLGRACHPHGIALDLRLQLGKLVAHQFGDRLRYFLVDPLLELRRLTDGSLRRRFDLAEVEDLRREA